MKSWSGEAVQVLSRVVGHAPASGEFKIVAAIGLLVLMISLRVSLAAGGMKDCGWPRHLLAAALGLAAMLCAAIAVSLYVEPLMKTDVLRLAVHLGGPLLALLSIGIPLQMLVLRGQYGQVLFAFAAAAISGLLAVMAVNAVRSTFKGEKIEFSIISARRKATEEFMRK